MNPIYHEIVTAVYKDRIYAERTLQLALTTGSGDYIAEILVNLDDGTCTYLELIPILEKIAAVDWFLHDEKYIPTEWEPDPNPNAKKSFKEWALKAIENLYKNAHTFSSSTHIHRALNSNNPHLIRTTLDMLAAEGNKKDNSLIPILEKIALKNEYKSYFSGLGYQTDCHLRELANSIIQVISKNDEEQLIHLSGNRSHELPSTSDSQMIDKIMIKGDEKKINDFFVSSCSICGALPNDITVSKGSLPDDVSKLEFKRMDSTTNIQLYCCPGCRTYYERIATGQSVNMDEERLTRLSWARSYELADSDDIQMIFFVRTCSMCGSLPDDITVNTGRDFYLPDSANKLELKGESGVYTKLYRCAGCGTYYERIDMPQMYGSGNCDEERLIRLSWEQSHLVDKSESGN